MNTFTAFVAQNFGLKVMNEIQATGKEKKVEDKAKPHLAIVICQRKADETCKLPCRWVVFLPLGSYPSN